MNNCKIITCEYNNNTGNEHCCAETLIEMEECDCPYVGRKYLKDKKKPVDIPVHSSDLLSVYDRFSHLDEIIRSLNSENKIYETCKELWIAICKEVIKDR